MWGSRGANHNKYRLKQPHDRHAFPVYCERPVIAFALLLVSSKHIQLSYYDIIKRREVSQIYKIYIKPFHITVFIYYTV